MLVPGVGGGRVKRAVCDEMGWGRCVRRSEGKWQVRRQAVVMRGRGILGVCGFEEGGSGGWVVWWRRLLKASRQKCWGWVYLLGFVGLERYGGTYWNFGGYGAYVVLKCWLSVRMSIHITEESVDDILNKLIYGWNCLSWDDIEWHWFGKGFIVDCSRQIIDWCILRFQ